MNETMRPTDQFAVHSGWRLLLRDLGINPGNVLRRARLPADLFIRDDATVSTDAYFDIWRALEAEADDPSLGIRIGQAVSVEMFDPPLFAATCSQNLNTALARIAQYKRLVCPMKLNVKPGLQGTRLEIIFTESTTVPPVSLATAELVFYVQLARLATRAKIQPLKLTAPEPPSPMGKYESYFGCPVLPGKSLTIIFSAEDATRPFLTANEKMWQFFEPELRKHLGLLTGSATTAERARGALLELLPAGDGSMHAVSQKIGMSARTLQRRLTEENVSFQMVLDETREQLARHYLRATRLSVAEISFLIGFQQPGSFSRAFSIWTGRTPEQLRDDV